MLPTDNKSMGGRQSPPQYYGFYQQWSDKKSNSKKRPVNGLTLFTWHFLLQISEHSRLRGENII